MAREQGRVETYCMKIISEKGENNLLPPKNGARGSTSIGLGTDPTKNFCTTKTQRVNIQDLWTEGVVLLPVPCRDLRELVKLMSPEKRTNACCRPPGPLCPPPTPPVFCHTSPSTGRCFSASPPPLSDGARTVWRGVAGGHRATLPPQLLCPPPHILCNLHLDDAKSWSATANLEGFAGEQRGIAREVAGDVREWGILGRWMR